MRILQEPLSYNNFFPAIGHKINGKIEILDGSRRRAAALLCHVGLSVLVTDSEISNDDARQLALDIQTSKEHNLREVGLRLLKLREKGMSQKEIALLRIYQRQRLPSNPSSLGNR